MLSDGQGMFRRRRGPGPVQFAVIDLGEILESFDHKAPPREVFTLGEVAAMAGEKPPTVHSWVKTGILVPSMRDRDGTRGRAMLFSRLDAFVACLIASLRRKCGLPLAKLRGECGAAAARRKRPKERRPQGIDTRESEAKSKARSSVVRGAATWELRITKNHYKEWEAWRLSGGQWATSDRTSEILARTILPWTPWRRRSRSSGFASRSSSMPKA